MPQNMTDYAPWVAIIFSLLAILLQIYVVRCQFGERLSKDWKAIRGKATDWLPYALPIFTFSGLLYCLLGVPVPLDRTGIILIVAMSFLFMLSLILAFLLKIALLCLKGWEKFKNS